MMEKPIRLLLVEDDQEDVLLIRELLSEMGDSPFCSSVPENWKQAWKWWLPARWISFCWIFLFLTAEAWRHLCGYMPKHPGFPSWL